MRNIIPVLAVLMVVSTVGSAKADLITVSRPSSVSAASASGDDVSRQTEDHLSLTRSKRREVQRKLAALGYRARISGRFDPATRDAIIQWQQSRGYPNTGFLDANQYQALLSENVTTADTSADHVDHGHRGRHSRPSRGIGGPIGAIGGAVVGLFHRL